MRASSCLASADDCRYFAGYCWPLTRPATRLHSGDPPLVNWLALPPCLGLTSRRRSGGDLVPQPSKIAFYADTFYNSPRSPAYWIPPADLDVAAILLGGDIHYRPELLGEMLRDMRRTQRDETLLIVVPGNGEYVGQELGEARREYRAAVDAVPGAVFLDDDVAELPGGLRVIGSTLWSHVPADEISAYNEMFGDIATAGVDHIRLGDEPLSLADCNELHRQARWFIECELRSLSAAERF